MVTVQRSIHIDVPVERVFELMADPAAKAGLNPLMKPITVEVEDGQRLRLGSRCHYRMQFGHNILDYHDEITGFEEGRLIESRTDSEPPVSIRTETVAEDHGTRLIQVETFAASDAMLAGIKARGFLAQLFQLGQQIAVWIDSDAMERCRSQREALLAEDLCEHLDRWLHSIKQHLESA